MLENGIEITVRAKFQTYGRKQMVLDEEGKPVRVFNKSSYNHKLVNTEIVAVTAAITKSQARRKFALQNGGWGARDRTWDGGIKIRCLTAWLRPNNL